MTTTASPSADLSDLSSTAQDVESAPQEQNPDPTCPDDIEQQPTEYHITETPVGAERPPSPPSCSKCSRLSKKSRRLQKENAYLRKRNRELKEELKCVSIAACINNDNYSNL